MICQSFKFRRSSFFYIVPAIGCLLLFLTGCSSLHIERFKNMLDNREERILDSGHEAFLQSDYDKAMHIFESLVQSGSNRIIRRKALYGLACTSLLKAQDTLQFDEALSLWDTWVNSAPVEFESEDPRLLGPFIQKIEPPCKKEKEIQALVKKKEKEIQGIVKKKEKEIQGIVKKKEKEIQALINKIDNMTQEMDNLQYQIKSLEAIDQTIEKKKKDIFTPKQ